MVLQLPPYNEMVNTQSDKTGTEKIYDNNIQKYYQSNIAYNPIYNNIYDLKPRIVEDTDKPKIESVSIFNMTLGTIMKNIANAILLVIIDMTKWENYSSVNNFLRIFLIENRLMYLGIFVVILAIYTLFFF